MWVRKPTVHWEKVSTQPAYAVQEGYRILVSQPTRALFPASMAVTRVSVDPPFRPYDAGEPILLVDPRNEFLQWNSTLDNQMAISEVFPIKDDDLGGGPAEPEQILQIRISETLPPPGQNVAPAFILRSPRVGDIQFRLVADLHRLSLTADKADGKEGQQCDYNRFQFLILFRAVIRNVAKTVSEFPANVRLKAQGLRQGTDSNAFKSGSLPLKSLFYARSLKQESHCGCRLTGLCRGKTSNLLSTYIHFRIATLYSKPFADKV